MSTSSYAWLPDHHLAVTATLAHADEVIAQAANILFDYQSQPEGIIYLREVSMETHSHTVVTGMAPIPKKIPLLAADALVTLRNALEHTLFSETEHRDGILEEKAAKIVEMPAARTYDSFKAWVKGRAKNGPPSLQPGSELLKRIEGLQPFHRTKDPQNHPLALLASHTNFSKHRAPALAAVRLAAIHREDRKPPSLVDVERRQEVPLRVGEVIAETPKGTQIPVSLFPAIGINRPGTDRWPVLMRELEELSTWVRTQAVPRLITGMEPPFPALPTRYEIALGHADDRAAISTGSMVSAAQLHKERIAATTARSDMVETLSQMPNAPSPEQIAAWLESVSDQELLARMRQLQIIETYEKDIVLNNFAVLEAMRDDASRFAAGDAGVDGD